METYRQYCPVAKAHEILGERWTMLIVRELVGGRQGFNEIARGLPGISRSLLTDRLRRLEQAGVLTRSKDGSRSRRYKLTDAGRHLKGVIDAFGSWGARWILDAPAPEDMDPGLLLWRMRHRMNYASLPDHRVVVRFDFRQVPQTLFWFVIENGEASVCVTDPGFGIDLLVSADLSAFHEVWIGRRAFSSAILSSDILIEGTPSFERAFQSWFLFSPMAEIVRLGRP